MIPLFKVHMPETAAKEVEKTLLSGYIGQGPKSDKFEDELRKWIGNPNVVAVNSGTSAIHLALRLAEVGPGMEVITTPMTCTATNMPILERGARIRWADIDPTTGNIDPESVKRQIRPNTKAIICVHWGGYPCDLDELNEISGRYGIPVIEDAAHAFGASYRGQPIGMHSRFVCFSFQAIKHLTTGDGGALVCREDRDYKRAQLLRWYGIDRNAKSKDLRCEADIQEYGYKFHMNDIAATIGLEQFPHLAMILSVHSQNARFYQTKLNELDVPGVELLTYRPDRASAYWLFTVLVKKRDAFIEWMRKQEIMVSQVHSRNDLHTAFQDAKEGLPGLNDFSSRQVSIPVGWWVSENDRERILSALVRWGKFY